MPHHYKCMNCYQEGYDFNLHDCPALVWPEKGESWEDYQKRSREHSAKWRKENGVE